MRIRTIKPEFWRSDDITKLSREDRLLFIGLWSYVDDNGVGVDDHRQIAADLFALEDNQNEAREFVRDGLATLSRGLLISRYEINGKHYFYINTWKRHQRVDRPNQPRYPLPPDPPEPPTSGNNGKGALSRDTLATPSRDVRETPSTGTGEQGNRGTGDKPPCADSESESRPRANTTTHTPRHVPPNELDAAAVCPDAYTLIGRWRAGHDPPYRTRTYRELGKQADTLLRDGADPELVLDALRRWDAHQGRTNPGLLPHLYDEAVQATRPRTARPDPRPSTTDARVAAAQALKARFADPSARPTLRAIPGAAS